MGTWRISADLLARCRFVVSPRIEATGALNDLVRPSSPAGRALAVAHREAFDDMLTRHPARRAVLDHSWRTGWISDWLSLPPLGASRSFDDELDDIRALGDRRVRAHLRESSPGGTLAPVLSRPGTAEHAAALLEWVWTHTLATDWARRERILRADIVSRTARLASHGWAAVLRDLGRDREWLGDGQLRINRYDLPSRVLGDDAELFFSPCTAPPPGSAGTCPTGMPSTTPSPEPWPPSTHMPPTASPGSSAGHVRCCSPLSATRPARRASSPRRVCRWARWAVTSRSCSRPEPCCGVGRDARCSTGARPSVTRSSPRAPGGSAQRLAPGLVDSVSVSEWPAARRARRAR